MKKLFTAALLMVGFAFASNAQQPATTSKENRKEEQKKMKESLHLSQDQEAQLKDADKEFRNQAKTIKENSSLSNEQKKEQLKSLHMQRMAKTNTILTPEQQKIRDEKKKQGHFKKKEATR